MSVVLWFIISSALNITHRILPTSTLSALNITRLLHVCARFVLEPSGASSALIMVVVRVYMHICLVRWSGLEGVRASARGGDCVSQEIDLGGSTFGLVGGGAF